MLDLLKRSNSVLCKLPFYLQLIGFVLVNTQNQEQREVSICLFWGQ